MVTTVLGGAVIYETATKVPIDTPAIQIEKYYRLQEELRIEYNKMGALYRAGSITEQEWQSFRDVNRAKAQELAEVYTPIRDAEWLKVYGVVNPKDATTTDAISAKKEEYKNSAKWTKEELTTELKKYESI